MLTDIELLCTTFQYNLSSFTLLRVT